jgi:threonine/homoserine/homoserine lactone efflux protein
MILSFFAQGAAIGIAAALSPGPFQSLIIAQSLLGGWRRAAPITFAPLLADIPIAFTLVFVLSKVPEGFLRAVNFAGAVLLIYLAWSLWKELRRGKGEQKNDQPPPLSRRNAFFQGVLMLFLSPGSYLFWSLVNGPILLEALDQSLAPAFSFLFAFYFFSIGGLLLIAFALSRVGQFNQNVRRNLQYASLILLLVIATLLLRNGLIA